MEREIKFRYWDGIKMHITDFHITCFGVIWKDTDDRIGLDEKRVLMQYTGLKDKNGIDIYEGDVAEDSEETYNILFGVYRDIEGIEHMGFYCKNKNGEFGLSSDDGMIFKVIGNIYEHPNLIDL